MRSLPPAPQPGSTMVGARLPIRTYRRRPVTASGLVNRVLPHAIEIVNKDGYYLLDPATAKEVAS